MTLKGAIYDCLRRRTPTKARRWLKLQPWFNRALAVAVGNEAYSASYYADIERIEGHSVACIAEWIVQNMSPRSVIDIGCGPGHLTAQMRERGVNVTGCDLSGAALRACGEKGLDVFEFDLTKDGSLLTNPVDLAICCEVAEHLGEEHADTFVEHLVSASRSVYLTAAEPEPGAPPGLYHVNEQPNAYWEEKLRLRGYELDRKLTLSAREYLLGSGVISYLAKPLVFKKAP